MNEYVKRFDYDTNGQLVETVQPDMLPDEDAIADALIDQLSEEELFQRELGAYARRYAGHSDHEIMVYLMREMLKLKRRYGYVLPTWPRRMTMNVTPPAVETSDHNTEAPSRSGS